MAASLRRFGAARSVVMDGKGIIRAGNATLEAARAEGIKSARIVEATGDELIVVRRRDWSDTEATAYGIADNRIAEHATWDDTGLADTLRALQSEDFDLGAVGFLDAEVDALVNRLANETLAEDGDDLAEGLDGEADDSLASGNFVAFKFGDYAGRVGRCVYDAFVLAYQAKQLESGEPMLDDVLRAWLGV